MKAQSAEAARPGAADRQQVFDIFRRWGYLAAHLDPLGHYPPPGHPELEIRGESAVDARRFYCGPIGADFWHIAQPEQRAWIQQRMESEPAPAPDPAYVLERLVSAEVFEQTLQARYLGTKRFSLEGITALVPLLDELLDAAAAAGAEESILAMSHRGRLNVMVHNAGCPAASVFAGFEDVDPRSVLGSGDVKYHLGATGAYATRTGRTVRMHLVSNPSHLEVVGAVAMGRSRAKQRRLGKDGHLRHLPIVLHGDAAFAGQGITAETLSLGGLRGFRVGGTVHVIVNNLIGFTTTPKELHPSPFSADLAKRLPIPIFHVNAEDADAVVRVARLACDYRYAFQGDVVVDLIGFRRHGHSEVDDPTITQPLLYKKIKEHPPLWKIYAQHIGADPAPVIEKVRAAFEAAQKEAEQTEKKPRLHRLPTYWDAYAGGRHNPGYEVDTGVPEDDLRRLSEALVRVPGGFHVHAKVQRLLDERGRMGRGEKPLDFGMAEALALASLLQQGIPIRLTGQDSRRGTFNQRHSVLLDVETEQEWVPLEHIASGQARCEIYNTMLSEAAVLGFEYGYSRDFPEVLVLWEAQFGDFANGAQIVIDQFIAAGEDKWGLLSGVVLLLPHGHEGQGPEHSSARIERYLQLAAEDNIQVCQPSSAAQYFHLLRRQALRRWRKPLVVFTPKSMLRHPDACSPLAELTAPRFQNVVADAAVGSAERILLCSGKIGHELRAERKRRNDTKTAILLLDQMYPLPETELAAEFERHSAAREIVWVQEEPANQGALFYALPRLERLAGRRPVRSVKRSASASPATGSAKAHELEQKTLLTLAFATST